MSFILKAFLIFVLAILVSAPADAFGGGGGGRGKRQPKDPDKTENLQKTTKAREEAYKNALKSIPDAKADKDPWKGAR